MSLHTILIPPTFNISTSNQAGNFIPLGLLNIAAVLEKNGFRASIFHINKRIFFDDDYRKTAKELLKSSPKIIGFSTWCSTFASTILLAKAIKLLDKNICILLGGPHASVLSEEILKTFEFIDYILAGEVEETILQFYTAFRKKKSFDNISGLSFRNHSGQIQSNKGSHFVSDLNHLPYPKISLISNTKSLSIEVGRGCPFHCSYCSTSQFFSKKYRLKTSERIVKEVKFAYEKNGIKTFSFDHDMFTLNKSFILELCEKLSHFQQEKNIQLNWTCSARIDCVDKNMLTKMRKSGCSAVFFGIETGSPNIQKSIHKNLNITKVYETAETCNLLGIKMHASFILGFPDETAGDLEKTLQCIAKLCTNKISVQCSELSVLPGTLLFQKYHQQLQFDGSISNFSSTRCNPSELQLIIQHPQLFSSFYHLPVQHFSRTEIVFLTRIINYLSEFENTLFLLKDEIIREQDSIFWVELFRNKFSKNLQTKHLLKNPLSFLIDWLATCIQKLKPEKFTDWYIPEVFAFESVLVLLKVRFLKWQQIQENKEKTSYSNEAIIRATPLFKIVNLKHRVEKKRNGNSNWELIRTAEKNKSENKTINLIVAINEDECELTEISKTEKELFDSMNNKSVKQFIELHKKRNSEKEITLWLKKRANQGIIEFIQPA